MKYYILKDKSIAASSARGIYMFSEMEWYPAFGIVTEKDLQEGEEIDEAYLNDLLRAREEKLKRAREKLFVDRISTGATDISSRIDGSGYLLRIPVIRSLLEGKMIRLTSPVTFFVGENGTGKSTLLEAIALSVGFNAEGGGKNFDFETRNTHSGMHEILRVSRIRPPKDGFFLRAESFYNLASNIDDLGVTRYYGGASLHDQSHGESFMALVRNRFHGNGLYILDEPEAALSPRRILALMKEIKRLVDADSQFIIATHSPILMTYPDAQIFECTAKGAQEKKYYELDGFNLTRDFLNSPEQMLGELFGKHV